MDKQTLNEFLELVAQKDGEKWVQWYKKEISNILKIDNYFLLFDKPSIKKEFCFGYGQNGVCFDDSDKIASKEANKARSNKDYFIKENLKEINKEIRLIIAYLKNPEDMSEHLDFGYKYRYNKPFLFHQNETTKTICYRFCSPTQIAESYKNPIRKLTINELRQILKVLKTEKQKLLRRLNTYLKKYGLSKIHSWTYLID